MNYPEVKTLLPQRFPILLVDEITELDPGHSISAKYYVDPKLPVFEGHFPGNPIFPGVYSIESIAQTGACLMLADEKNAGMTPIFLGINETRFLKAILPGDTLELHSEFTAVREDKKIYTLKGSASVNGETAVTSESVVILK